MRYLLILSLMVSLGASAQLKSFELVNGDTINRVDAKGMKQGMWVIKVPPGRGERGYEEEGIFRNDLREGVWKKFSPEGDMLALEGYRYGMKDGKCAYFTNAGEPLREESWRAIDPKNPFDTVNVYDVDDPSKILRKQIVKVEPKSYKHGTWTYFNTLTGGIESTEKWVMNQLDGGRGDGGEATAGIEDDLAPIDPKTGRRVNKPLTEEEKKKLKKPAEVAEFEKKNSGKKKVKMRDGQTGG